MADIQAIDIVHVDLSMFRKSSCMMGVLLMLIIGINMRGIDTPSVMVADVCPRQRFKSHASSSKIPW